MDTSTPSAQVTPPPTFGSPAPTPEPAPAPEPQSTPPVEPKADPAPTAPEAPKEEARVVPERYELALPEGSYMDQSSLARVESYAKTNKLTQAEAQDLLKQQDADVAAVMKERRDHWLEETRNDRELGGTNLQKNVETARQFLDKHMAPELRQELDRTGYGNNRHFMKFVLDMASRSANDRVVMPGQQGSMPSDRSVADLFYADTTSKNKY